MNVAQPNAPAANREAAIVKQPPSGAAAFFDVDGTLVALPTLERRFMRELHRRGQIPKGNAVAWLVEAAWRLPQGIERACYANKALLRGIPHEVTRQAAETVARQALPVTGMTERVVWHARRRDAIVLVTGTLRELANAVARRLEGELHAAGYEVDVVACATELGRQDTTWSGRVRGKVMCGREKGAAVRRLAAAHGWRLADSWAYGDSASDRWMLEAVGHAVAVNPAPMLARMANEHGWPVLGSDAFLRPHRRRALGMVSRRGAAAGSAARVP